VQSASVKLGNFSTLPLPKKTRSLGAAVVVVVVVVVVVDVVNEDGIIAVVSLQ